jgi:hypothetical protein
MEANMMNKIFILLIMYPFFAYAGSLSIPIENRVILQSDFPKNSTWIPTEEQTNIALGNILEFINNPNGVDDWQKSEIGKIKSNIALFKVQFIGIESEGKKRIWCNFFRGEGFDYWKKGIVFVLDGGFWFWQIEYDLETGTCMNFNSNGYA